jgi:hypothetical protein
METHVDERMALTRDVRHGHTDLTVLFLAQSATPLPRHPDTPGPLLGEGRGIEHDHAVGSTQVGPDLPCQRPEQRSLGPGDQAEGLLEPLSLSVVEVSDPLARLVLELGEQAGQVLDDVPPLLRRGQRRGERRNAGLQACQQALGEVRRHLGLRQHLLQPGLTTSLHEGPPSVKRF